MIITDQLNRKLTLNKGADRIVSLVPSISEMIADLKGIRSLTGITRFCNQPEGLRTHARIIGGTKNPDLEKIIALEPDLIFANKEENNREDIERLAERFPVFVSDVRNLEDALELIGKTGELLNVTSKALEFITLIRTKVNQIVNIGPADGPRVLYLIWKDPYMSVGGDTFIHHMLTLCGFRNTMESEKRYPVTEREHILEARPEAIFLSSEPYPFSEKHLKEFDFLPKNTRIWLVDGMAFSWYGTGLARNLDYLINFKMEMELR
jgi:ABC-type Fe3+-hydroxamate transport system substrate-binding protein